MQTYHKGRSLAIVCGLAATGGALAILLADPYTTGNWRLDHVLLPIIVAITIAAGHLFGSALRSWRFLPAVGFALVFAMGTVLTVYSSVGAQKSGLGARQDAVIAHHNELITAKRADVERAKTRLEQANAMADREMTGQRCGVRCNDWKLRAQEVSAHIRQIEGSLNGLGAEQVAPSKARPFAEAMGVLGFDAVKVEKITATFEPFAYSLLFELTAIIAFGYGFSFNRQAPKVETTAPSVAAPLNQPEPLSDSELDQLRKMLIGAGRPLTNQEVAALMGVSEGQATKKVAEAVAAGLLHKARAGRNVAISALH